MDHQDHVDLLREGVQNRGGKWADFGSGRGAFTLALAELLNPQGEIYSVDKNASALRTQKRIMLQHFPDTRVHYLSADFTKPLAIPPLDGIVIANALHFIKNKIPVVKHLQTFLKKDGCFIIVEYNTDRGNMWVPYPVSYNSWEKLASQTGFASTRKIAARPSSFLGEIYAALSHTPLNLR
ncbi:MAG: methyltransferase domain-containing protein [Anaerolineales bacterium]|jgi:ubiquinone/menaquinone biosynthesis C-methylase UbiE